MASLSRGLCQLRCHRHLANPQWHHQVWRPAAISPCVRHLNTDARTVDASIANSLAPVETVQTPYQGIQHARTVPATPSYFSREPQFNDSYIRIANLLNRYQHLPTVSPGEAPQVPWMKLEEMRAQMGEPIKALHYAKVLRVAKRLNLIEPTLRPAAVKLALQEFTRDINPFSNLPRPVTVDKFGRAVGVGKRKASTARAFLVEGNGEVLVNGKPLNQAFGRVHDRESALWALTSTERLDKYNVWVLVEGGGTTGQAEAITLAVAKALLAHEPALKPALRKAGCITRDPRTVERKKHGHVKARKMPAWVKR
ncbi:uncharacterized protein UV8b_03141 [Ustilaginoidea virens]|uniref:Small ribosomal subunit protein uS9m n=1 Tax=Ustilaginoidea virens TaxID=1159556 RepID=A0A1B5L0Z7_USTVR|nr:uncharacterized protein UV8b_03141 [Ustilaginoidea virens]QUC18900.1 hypothetical protein UV8b_03141 [Ustilaginoidea virens]GAO17043.1 hypothetical protein UVI_02021830 [Ustilaginoidea virens]